MKKLLDRTLVGARWLTLGVAGVWTLACSNAHSLGEDRREDVGSGGTTSNAGGTGGFAAQEAGGTGGFAAGGAGGQGGSGGTAGSRPDPDPGDPDAHDPGASCPNDCSGPGAAQVRFGVAGLVNADSVAVVCHNDHCVTLDAAAISNSTVTCAGKDRVSASLTLEVGIPEAHVYTLVVSWGFGDGTVLADGDEYSLQMTTAAGVATSKARAHYEPAASVCGTGNFVMAVMPNVQDEVCCPRAPAQSGCMLLGGAYPRGSTCGPACDFWCSDNWRVEFDEHGCEGWRYDYNPGTCDAGGAP
jgi:hypothetical protein